MKYTGTSIVPENTLSWLHHSQTSTSGRALLDINIESCTVYHVYLRGMLTLCILSYFYLCSRLEVEFANDNSLNNCFNEIYYLC